MRHSLAIAFAGLLATLGVAAVPLLFGDAPLTHYPPPGSEPVHAGTIELMSAVLFDVGIFVLVFGFAVGVVSFFARAIASEEGYAGPARPSPGGEER